MTVTAEERALTAAAESRSGRPSLDVVWAALATVPDPEVPVISIVELGIVRAVAWENAQLVVHVTPTYSGCPATEMIGTMIRETLGALGVTDVVLVNRLSPPWSTDWIAPEARERLRSFGIAPPHVIGGRVDSAGDPADQTANRIDVTGISPLRRADVVVPCPRCGSAATKLLSQFGSTACKAQYRCTACREPFDYFKPH